MSELFARIFVFIGASFCLGLAVGFVLWRAGRHNLSRREWATMRKELARSEHAFARATERLRTAEEQADRLRTDLTRTNLRMAESDRQRATALEHAQASEAALAIARDELTAVESQALYLRRRLTDLSILAGTPTAVAKAPPLDLRSEAPDPASRHHAALREVDVRLASEESVAFTR